MPSQPDLPSHVQRIVDEIENEIGDEPNRPAATIEGIGSDGSHGANGRVEAAVHQILEEIGEDPDRQGLIGTPERVHRMYTELTAGYHVDPERLINGAIFDIAYSEMVVVKEIPFYSLCEHHLLPFFGTAAVAYIPKGRVIGLSKIPRIVEMYGRRLQVQERLTQQIAEFLQERLEPQGVGVVLEATHLCAVMRGVRKPGTVMTTSYVLGLFRTRDRTRAEYRSSLRRRGRIRRAPPSGTVGECRPRAGNGRRNRCGWRPCHRGQCRPDLDRSGRGDGRAGRSRAWRGRGPRHGHVRLQE